jgi:hypothetical protein
MGFKTRARLAELGRAPGRAPAAAQAAAPRTGARRLAGGRRRAQVLCLSDAWRRWIASCAHAGAEPGRILETLLGAGVPEELARRELDTIVSAMQGLSGRLKRAELVLALMQQLSPRQIERVPLCDAGTFYRCYLGANRPVLFSDGCRPLGVVGTWTPEYLRAVAGTEVARVSAGRDRRPGHYVDPEHSYHTMPVTDIVDRVLSGGPSNDLYIVSRNRVLEGPLAGLLADLQALPDFLERDLSPGSVSLWFGPAGTFTPLHHDTSNILSCQIFGRKRFHLAPPVDRELLFTSNHGTFYSDADLAAHASRLLSVELGPGEALFLPIGWWHAVSALEISISLSFTGFRRPNACDWYRPGEFAVS